ncbi:thioesterase II family protein [Streptomyces sp. NPDC001315]|uniref:thioesterase II family protein n=1 Tax=Streptomyces sp. NPDC001315 TaxID=3364562 RepID=UPI0036ADABC2
MAHRPTGRNKWLPRPPSAAAAGRVFCIPYSGSGASMYRQWPREQDGVEFLPVELPGRETRFAEPVPQTYQELAAAMIPALEPYLDVPFAFFGHCSSALAAYEVSAELIRTGLPAPARLYVSSQVAPQDGPAGRFLTMDDAGFAAELEQLVTEQGGTPNPDLIELYVEVLRADVDTYRRYVMPDPYPLSCPITVVGWTEDDIIPYDTMGGWPKCGETTSVLLEGRHHRLMEAPQELLRLLTTGLGAR